MILNATDVIVPLLFFQPLSLKSFVFFPGFFLLSAVNDVLFLGEEGTSEFFSQLLELLDENGLTGYLLAFFLFFLLLFFFKFFPTDSIGQLPALIVKILDLKFHFLAFYAIRSAVVFGTISYQESGNFEVFKFSCNMEGRLPSVINGIDISILFDQNPRTLQRVDLCSSVKSSCTIIARLVEYSTATPDKGLQLLRIII